VSRVEFDICSSFVLTGLLTPCRLTRDPTRKNKKGWKGKRKRNASKDESRHQESDQEQRREDEFAHIKCHSCDEHLASGCPNKLEKKAQANKENQGNEKHHMSKEEKAQSKRKCYSCRERGHMANSCPLGNTPKSISIDANIMLRKDDDGIAMVVSVFYKLD
jgi:hypothetical protein